jgi:acetyl esterase/lipase
LPKKTDYSIQKNIVIEKRDGGDLIMDLYKPDGAKKAPMVLVLHGGGWRARSGDMSTVCEDLARQGFVAVNGTYRLAPENIFPAALDDAKFTLGYMRAHAEDLGGDPSRIFVWGYSAGGHLALLLGLDPANDIKAIVAGAPPSNLTQFPGSGLIIKFLGKQYKDDPKLWERASPFYQASAKSPAVFLYHGQWDMIVNIDQSRELVTKLKSLNVPVDLKEIPYLGHIGVYLLSESSVDEGIGFIQKHMSSESYPKAAQ